MVWYFGIVIASIGKVILFVFLFGSR